MMTSRTNYPVPGTQHHMCRICNMYDHSEYCRNMTFQTIYGTGSVGYVCLECYDNMSATEKERTVSGPADYTPEHVIPIVELGDRKVAGTEHEFSITPE